MSGRLFVPAALNGKNLQSDATAPVNPVIESVTVADVPFARIDVTVSDKNGKVTTIVDYGSAGKNWKKRITAWLTVSEDYLNNIRLILQENF